MQQKSGYQEAMQYQRTLDAKSSKPLPTPEKFLQICEEEYTQQVGGYDPDLYKNLQGLVMEHLYLESHSDAKKLLLHQVNNLLKSEIQ